MCLYDYGLFRNASVLENVLYMLSMLCVGFLEEMIFRGFLFCAMAKENEEIVGYFLCYFVLDEWEIARIAVSPNARRKGIGQCLFDYMMSTCKEKKMVRILLDVRESNFPAISFYKKNGFTVDGIRKNFYGGIQPEHAVLMSCQISE